ncbi:MAG: helix-hairpin-helix domain-containing protein [Bacteroidales bacterium]|nr:helix-hairpin-helix domain-containing protein [Bacteroidales bacterium]
MENSKRGRPSASFVVGSVALLFLIIGYQSALFITKASVARIVANHDHPDTVFVYVSPDSVALRRNSASAGSGSTNSSSNGIAERSGRAAESIWRARAPRRYESFKFDPNTVSVNDLMRLGFSEKQARAIDNYRKKGGRFRRKSDFAKSYVVEDSVYRRLENYIDIPKIDINKADSAAFETLPGIGKFFASKMVSYRKELRGYSYPEQLMDIWHFDQEKFDGLKDLITVGPSEPYPLWTLPESELSKHPYIGKRAAHGIIVFRENSPKEDWTVVNLKKAGILDPGLDDKLLRCGIAPPPSP